MKICVHLSQFAPNFPTVVTWRKMEQKQKLKTFDELLQEQQYIMTELNGKLEEPQGATQLKYLVLK